MHLHVLRRAALTVAAVSLAVAAGASPVAAATPPTFDVTVGYGCTIVTGTPTAGVQVSQLTSGGSVLETKSQGFGGDGTVQVCFDDQFLPGMKVRATTEGLTRTFTIPNLTLGTDRTTDVVRGKAPAGRTIRLTVDHRVQFTVPTYFTYTRTTSSTGSWSVDTTAKFNLLGGDGIHVEYDDGTDTAHLWAQVPQLTIRINASRIFALRLPQQSGSVVLRSSSGTVRGKAYVAAGYDFEAGSISQFITTLGSRVGARVGDTVSAPFQPSMAFTIPNVTVAVNTTTDVVSGACPANRRMLIQVDDSHTIDMFEATCGAAGTYAYDTSAKVDIIAGMRVTTGVKLRSGDVVERVKIAS